MSVATTRRTQVAIIGGGPAGLLLSHLLYLRGIDSIVVERRDPEYLYQRVRAGVLDSSVVDLLVATGLGERMLAEGMLQEQMEYRFEGQIRFINWREQVGRQTMVYGQQEVVRDVLDARLRDGGKIVFDAQATEIGGLDRDEPVVRFLHDGDLHEIHADFVAACDGFHGIGRPSIPTELRLEYERVYPFQWLGILAEARPGREWLVTGAHQRGYAMHSMRSPTISRNYLQVPLTDTVDDWTDERIWAELHIRLEDEGDLVAEGPILNRSMFTLRNFVCEPMQYGRLFLAGDAAHIVPPTGGRGLNQAIADVATLADAMASHFDRSDDHDLEDYSRICLERVWKAQLFTASQTNLLQVLRPGDAYARRIQVESLDQATSDPGILHNLAENYAGRPFRSSFLSTSDE